VDVLIILLGAVSDAPVMRMNWSEEPKANYGCQLTRRMRSVR